MNNLNKTIEDWNKGSDEWFRNTNYDELFLVLENDPYKGFPNDMAELI